MAAAWIAAFILSLPIFGPPGIPAVRSPVFWMVPGLWLLMLLSLVWSAAPMSSFIAFATFSLFVQSSKLQA